MAFRARIYGCWKNIRIKWRHVKDYKIEPVLKWYFEKWALASTVVFNTAIKNFPTSIKNLLVSAGIDVQAVAEDKLVSSNKLCRDIVNGIFENNMNALAAARSTPKHELDLDFDDVNAYGETLKEGVTNEFVCCICGEESEGYGNNPAPVKESGKCCDACNRKFVIPARLNIEIED